MDISLVRKLENTTRKQKQASRWIPILTLGLGLLIWGLFTTLSGLPDFILPRPAQVWDRFLHALADGSLLKHTWVTLSEVLPSSCATTIPTS